MTRDTSSATKQDLDWLKLQKEIRKIIKNKKEWRKFLLYMAVYFK